MTTFASTPTLTPEPSEHAPAGQGAKKRQNPIVMILLIVLALFIAVLAIATLGVIALRSGTSTESTTVASGAEISVSEPAAPAPPAAVVPPAAAVPPAAGFAWLRVDGLGDFAFGDNANTVVEGLQASFGEPTSQDVQGDCPGGIATLVNFSGLTLHMTDEQFMGWVYTGSSPALSTPSGVALGTTVETLNTTYPGVDVFDSSLGTEFYFEVPSGYIAGFLEAQSVASLYAGQTCFFR